MTKAEMMELVKGNLQISGDDRNLLISDIIVTICDYCNLSPQRMPSQLEPIVRGKAKGVIDYESENGTGFNPEVQSIKEGDGSITWAQTEGNTKATIYGLTASDKADLRRHRRPRGYA